MTNDKYCFYGYVPNETIIVELLKHSYIKRYTKDSYIISQGELNNKNMFLLLDGTVEISRISIDGEKSIIGIYSKKVLFGESAFSDLPRPVSVKALTNVKVAVLKSIMLLNLDTQFSVILELFKTHLYKFDGILELNEDLRTKNLKERLYDLLVVLANEAPKIIEENNTYAIIKITHEDIASIICANRVNVSLELASMKEQGFVRLYRGRIDFKLN